MQDLRSGDDQDMMERARAIRQGRIQHRVQRRLDAGQVSEGGDEDRPHEGPIGLAQMLVRGVTVDRIKNPVERNLPVDNGCEKLGGGHARLQPCLRSPSGISGLPSGRRVERLAVPSWLVQLQGPLRGADEPRPHPV